MLLRWEATGENALSKFIVLSPITVPREGPQLRDFDKGIHRGMKQGVSHGVDYCIYHEAEMDYCIYHEAER
jgi:hypothetical protein